VISSGFPAGIARVNGGFGGTHGGSFCFSEALAWVGRGQGEVGDGLGGERRVGIRVGRKRGQMGDVSYRSDGEVRKFVFRGLEAVSRWSSRARPPDADGGTSRPREGSLRGLRSFLASLQDASWEVDLDRWHRSCLAQPPAKGSQASGLNAMGCSTFKVVWGWGDEMKRAKARTTSGVTGTQRKSVGASELSRRDRRSQFGGDHSFSGESFGPRGGWRTSRPTGHALASAATDG
jgi:hypothetical protein